MTVRSSLSKEYLTKHQTVSEFDLSVGFYSFFAIVCKTALCFSHCLSFFFNFSFFSLAFLGGLTMDWPKFFCLSSIRCCCRHVRPVPGVLRDTTVPRFWYFWCYSMARHVLWKKIVMVELSEEVESFSSLTKHIISPPVDTERKLNVHNVLDVF